MKRLTNACSLLLATMVFACNNQPATQEKATPKAGISKAAWGTSDGNEVQLYTLTNDKGTVVTISTYGGTVTSWKSPDKKGDTSSIIVGFDSLGGYLAHPPYFGALIGRYGNRIAKGKFSIGKDNYTLATNDGANHLHGGTKGFDKVVWTAATTDNKIPVLHLTHLSKDGEEGYPGNLNVHVIYTLTNDDELKIEYEATTDKPTPVNLTNHSYFNLTGSVANNILGHILQINADKYTPVDSTLIPTGELKPVKGTPFDFTTPTAIGARIDSVKGGYDHNFVLNRKDTSLQLAATLSDTTSGRELKIYTTEPGLQFYSGNFLDGKFKTSNGVPITQHSALCLETQHFPNSPNQSSFPNTILQPGVKYHSVTVYKLSVDKK